MPKPVTILNKFVPKDFLDGTRLLSPPAELAYWRICALIYDEGNGLPDNDAALRLDTRAGSKWRRVKAELIERGKIYIGEDGLIWNERCRAELEKMGRISKQRSEAGKARQGTLLMGIDGGKSASEKPSEISAHAGPPAAPLAGARETSIPSIGREPSSSPPSSAGADAPMVMMVVDRFFEARRTHFPDAEQGPGRRRIAKEAAAFIAIGHDPGLVADVAARQMGKIAVAGGSAPSSLRFCHLSLRSEAASERPREPGGGASEKSAHADGLLPRKERPWPTILQSWRRSGRWLGEVYGPAPGEEGCQVPAELLMPHELPPKPEAASAA